jgi:hypothetical protein
MSFVFIGLLDDEILLLPVRVERLGIEADGFLSR